MGITAFSFIMAIIWNSIFILLLYIGRKRKVFIHSFGVASMVALYGFSTFRMLFPLEFPFTAVVDSSKIYPNIRDTLYHTVKVKSGSFHVWQGLCIGWLVFSIVSIAITVIQYLTAVKGCRFMKATEDRQICEIFKRVQMEYGKPIKVVIIKNKGIHGAMSAGIVRKYILLPDRIFSDEELYCIISHEYMHLKAHDQVVKLLSMLYCNIFWWNPLSYLLLKDLEQSLELKCDYNVLKDWSVEDKCEYMSAVIKDARRGEVKHRSKGASYLAGTDENAQLKERFRMIMKPQVKKKNKAMIAVLMCLFIFSYSFVIQSTYEAPVEDIVTEPGIYEIPEDDIYIRKNKNGEYEFVDSMGSIVISEQTARAYISEGFYFKWEEYK